ncbi:MAG: AraC family transcriptional regulator ligand-binding domain-containing protein [Myxococcales bacterium]
MTHPVLSRVDRALGPRMLLVTPEDEAPELLVSRTLLQPFGELARLGPESGIGSRVPLSAINRWLEDLDCEAGLRALERFEVGTGDVTEYLAASSASWGEALEVIIRYARLLSDAADFCLHEHAERAVFELRTRARIGRPLGDFQVGLLALAARSWLGHLQSFEFWFAHPRPHDLGDYTRIFGLSPLRFDAPCDAVVFDRALLKTPLKESNQRLHAVLRRHADSLLSELPPLDLLTGRVRELVLQLLPVGKSDVRYAAERLNMSRRTLARRLKTEGASYREVVEEARHTLARRYLALPNLDVKEIAFLLGYSETAAFSRAFRRWAGQSPLQYRESHMKTPRVAAGR